MESNGSGLGAGILGMMYTYIFSYNAKFDEVGTILLVLF